jgi:hypothetical protein
MVAFGGPVYGLWLDTRLARCLEIVFAVGDGAGVMSECGVYQLVGRELSGKALGAKVWKNCSRLTPFREQGDAALCSPRLG